MRWDWMRMIEMPMGIEDWRRLPRNAAYKYEYIEGQAQISPEPVSFDVVLRFERFRPVVARDLRRSDVRVRRLEDRDWEALPGLMARAFVGVAPFATLSGEELEAVAKESIADTRNGCDGESVPSACVVAEDDKDELIGAALVTLRKVQSGPQVPLLTWTFVDRWERRRGVAEQLLGCVVGACAELGYVQIESVVCSGNHASMIWHWREGFEWRVRLDGEGT
ncbi:MAG: GNAT family N-acetyltransferase [Phycisphaerae bacterium]